MSVSLLSDFIQNINKNELNLYGVSVAQHGELLGSHRWTTDEPHELASLTKSFTSTAIGMLIEEKKLSLSTKVFPLFPDKIDFPLSPQQEALTVRDLLIMASGHEHSLLLLNQRSKLKEKDWVKYFLSTPLIRMPGQTFVYDSGCSHLLSAIVQKVTGEKLRDYLIPRLFLPLGIPDPFWYDCPMGITFGGAGLKLRTNDLIKFGQLYLNGGKWNGQQLVSKDWIKEATRKQIDTNTVNSTRDGSCGYGYQFWMCHEERSFRADGAYSQFCIVLPNEDAVIAINSHEQRSQDILDCVWESIVPKLMDR